MVTRHTIDFGSGPASADSFGYGVSNRAVDYPCVEPIVDKQAASGRFGADEAMNALAMFWPDWHYEGLIGRGAFGSVHKVSREWPTHSVKAVKMIEVGGFTTFNEQTKASYYENLRENMVREIQMMENLDGVSQNIVRIEDSHICDRRNGEGFIIGIRMDLLEGLYEHIGKIGGINPIESVRVARDVCKALVACHSHNPAIIHHDVKPANIFWSEKLGVYQLGDFGVARQLDDDARARRLSYAGTDAYVAPEVVARLRGSARAYGCNADVYSLGMVLFYLLNDDMPPFDNDEKRLRGERLPDPKHGDEYLANVIRSATNAEPEYRFHSAQAFLNALEAWLAKKQTRHIA